MFVIPGDNGLAKDSLLMSFGWLVNVTVVSELPAEILLSHAMFVVIKVPLE